MVTRARTDGITRPVSAISAVSALYVVLWYVLIQQGQLTGRKCNWPPQEHTIRRDRGACWGEEKARELLTEARVFDRGRVERRRQSAERALPLRLPGRRLTGPTCDPCL